MKKYAITLMGCFVFIVMANRGASAQVPTSGNVFVGYSYMSADLGSDRANLNGWNASVEGKVFPFIGIVADFDGHYGSPSVLTSGVCTTPPGGQPGGCILTASGNFSQHDFLFGPRASVTVGKIRPFANILFGAGHVSESGGGFSTSNTSFAYAVGGGVDYHLVPLVSWRVSADLLQTRFFSNTQNNVRISTGIVVHF